METSKINQFPANDGESPDLRMDGRGVDGLDKAIPRRAQSP
jgi:hypothetical protein